MACSFKSVSFVPENNMLVGSKTKGVLGLLPPVSFPKLDKAKSREISVVTTDFKGNKPVVFSQEKGSGCFCNLRTSSTFHAQATSCISRGLNWWKNLKPNMIEIHSAQELVNSLVNAGDVLVVVDFYSPGCGGCKALHPKICQIAESYPSAMLLQVNYEELKTMCHNLHIHVLPFFRFYRGAEGRVCSFSCTNATIKKFKDALAKHGNERCSLSPAKGLDESELKALASSGEISANNSTLLYSKEGKLEDLVLESHDISSVWSIASNNRGLLQDIVIS